jgi:uncharacterized membrane protein YsdA (DUF1294 family)/cold shock CspA family protein
VAVRRKGTIKNWNADKGFGFISPSSGGKDVFLHITSLQQRSRSPETGETVVYTLSKDKQNRLCAVDATFDGEKLKRKTKQRNGASALASAALFLLFVAAVAYNGHVPVPVLWLYLAASFITLMVYWNDKSAARKGEWRTPESTLHTLALVGGWPGALVAQSLLRHKSSKTSFRVVFFLTVFFNVMVLLWALTPLGSATLVEWLNFYL